MAIFRMQEWMNDLVGATYFSLIASTLEKHVRQALQSGWALPQQHHLGDSLAAAKEGRAMPLAVVGMWPYWLDGREQSTVRNSMDLGSMAILTGTQI